MKEQHHLNYTNGIQNRSQKVKRAHDIVLSEYQYHTQNNIL